MTNSLDVFWEDLVFLEASLLAVPEAAELVMAVRAHLAELEHVVAGDKNSRRALVQARALASVVDAALDDGVREVQSHVLHLVRQDRKDRRYVAVFKGGLSKAIKTTSLSRQIGEVERIGDALALPVFEDAFRDAQLAYIEGLLERGREGLLASERAEKGRVVNRIRIDDWKRRANVVRMDVYGWLMVTAAEKGKGKKWVRSFYPALKVKAKKEVVVDGEVGGGEAGGN